MKNNPTLQRGSKLNDDIERLQLALDDLGHPVDIDAQFGPGLEREVKAFQAEHGLPVDGIVDAAMWRVLAAQSSYGRSVEIDTSSLSGFRGDMAWIHRLEGHSGKPYWPGGASGVTLDPGLDLGHAKRALIEKTLVLYRLTSSEIEAVRRVCSQPGEAGEPEQPGKRGKEAKKALDRDTVLQSIRVPRFVATQVFPVIAEPYWDALRRRFEWLPAESTPGAVQTAMLSLAYNRGAGNRALGALAEPLARGEWQVVADLVGTMQQDHQLAGIQRRRRAEAELIRSTLA